MPALTTVPALTGAQSALLDEARRAVLATIRDDGRPRLVPITYAHDTAGGALTVYSPLDDKPKSVADPRRLARVRDILARPRVSVLVDRWSEDWAALAWLRLDGVAALVEPDEDADAEGAAEHERAVALLRARYPQYRAHRLEERPLIRIEVVAVTGWSGA